MSKIQAWLYAFRLRTLPLAFSSIITGGAIAFIQNREHFKWHVFSLCLLTTLLLQILSNLANDYGDSEKGTDNDNRIGPVRAVQGGMLSLSEMKIGIIITTVLSLVCGTYLVIEGTKGLDLSKTVIFMVLGVAAIAAAIKYTIGENAYGYSGLGDVAVFIFFGLVGVYGSYYLLANQGNYQVFMPAFSIGAFSAAVLNLNNMRDIQNDILSRKMTLVGRIGLQRAKQYHNTIIILGFIATLMYVYMNLTSSMQFLFILTLLLFKKHLAVVNEVEDPKDFDPQLKQLAISIFIFSVLFAMGIIIGSETV